MAPELIAISPIDGSVAARRPYASAAAIRSALTQAGLAQAAWRNSPLSERSALIARAVDVLVSNKDAIGEELTRQMGRPIRYTPGEVRGMESRARHMIAIAAESLSDVVPAPTD